ncbi:MAG: tail fiber protein [Caldilineales bacterium]
MSDPFIGEIQPFPFDFAPRGWAQCNGQLLPVNQYQALFSLLGTTYGGNGMTTFALPDLRGRIPLHTGTNQGMTFSMGQSSGEEVHTLNGAEMPAHIHSALASANTASVPSPVNATWANSGDSSYAATPDTQLAANALGANGGNQAHENRPPYLALNFCIALVGIYPSHP